MDYHDISLKNGSIHVEGFPDAVKVIALKGKTAQRLSHLAQHKMDLDFASKCLLSINLYQGPDSMVREALWRSAIIFYCKCFGGSKARFQLSAEKILRNEVLGLEVHSHFMALRNKYYVHDENPLSQTLVGAAINAGGKPFKVEKVLGLTVQTPTLLQENFSNLSLLARVVLDWVIAQIDEVSDQLAGELETRPLSTLLSTPSLTFTAPQLDDVSKTKNPL